MAIVPKYGRRVQAPGPVPFSPNTGPLHDAGLHALAGITGKAADILAKRDQAIRDAQQTTEIIGRTAQFTIKLDEISRAAIQQPTKELQDKFFIEQSEKLRADILAWPSGDREAQTELNARIVRQYTQELLGFRQSQDAIAFKSIRDNLEVGWEQAIAVGDKELASKIISDGVRVGAISATMGQAWLDGFDVDHILHRARKDMTDIDRSDVDATTKIAGLTDLESRLQDIREEDVTERQWKNATSLLEAVRQDMKAVATAHEKAKKDFIDATGRSVYGDMTAFEYTGGKEGKLYTVAELKDLHTAGALTHEAYNALLSIATGRAQPDPWASLQAEVLVTDVESGIITIEEAQSKIIELAPRLTVEERARFNKDIASGRASWRSTIRSAGAREIDSTVHPQGEYLPTDRTVSAVAKKRFWAAIREMEDKREILDYSKMMEMATNIAWQTKMEWSEDRAGFNDKYGFGKKNPPQLGQEYELTATNPTTGETLVWKDGKWQKTQ